MVNWLDRNRLVISLVLISILTLGTLFFLRKNASSEIASVPTTLAVATPVRSAIKVYVVGAIRNPGVYTFNEGERVQDALLAAGGTTPEADLTQINLAVKLRDEMQITIPVIQSIITTADMSNPTQRIDINSASTLELDSLPRVGNVTSKRIVDYRTKNGRFRTTGDLVEKKLVTQSVYDEIKDLIEAR